MLSVRAAGPGTTPSTPFAETALVADTAGFGAACTDSTYINEVGALLLDHQEYSGYHRITEA